MNTNINFKLNQIKREQKRQRKELTFFPFTAAWRWPRYEILGGITVRCSTVVWSLSGRTRNVCPALIDTRAGPSVVAEIAHTRAFPNRPVGQSDPEELHTSVRTRPWVVPIMAAMRAPPSHGFRVFEAPETGFESESYFTIALSLKPEDAIVIRIGSEYPIYMIRIGRWFRACSLPRVLQMGRDDRERKEAREKEPLYPYNVLHCCG